MIIDYILKRIKIEKINSINLPSQIKSLIVSGILGIIFISIILGPGFIFDLIIKVIDNIIHPMDVSRFGLTVAENKQPYFANDWKGSFGPIVLNIPLYFWMFVIGSIVLFKDMISKMTKKENILLTLGYSLFLICLIFSNYAQNSTLNGDSAISIFVYFFGAIVFGGLLVKIYWNRFNTKRLKVFKEFDFGYILYFIIFTMSIIGARGAVRLIMILASVTPIAAAYLIVKIIEKWQSEKDNSMKMFFGILSIIILLSGIFSLYVFYNTTEYSATNMAPNVYTQQWQQAMGWVRNETPKDAVFAHWWDYGYWVQSIGERATILDGANAIGYWNHLMGRNVLTGTNEKDALDFLYTHNATHLLIDSTDIGKYTAYSSIGSDEDYDRFSWINTFLIDEKQTQESRNETLLVYPGTILVDEDIIYKKDGQTIFLPRKKSYLIGVVIRATQDSFSGAEGVYVYNNNQYRIPLKYIYFKNRTIEFENGIDAGVFIYPAVKDDLTISKLGAAMYLSHRTWNSNMAQFYLMDKKSNYFSLAHTESDYIINNLRNQGTDIGEFIFYNGFRGPIKMWEISYPDNVEYKPEYLEINFPTPELNAAKMGEY